MGWFRDLHPASFYVDRSAKGLTFGQFVLESFVGLRWNTHPERAMFANFKKIPLDGTYLFRSRIGRGSCGSRSNPLEIAMGREWRASKSSPGILSGVPICLLNNPMFLCLYPFREVTRK